MLLDRKNRAANAQQSIGLPHRVALPQKSELPQPFARAIKMVRKHLYYDPTAVRHLLHIQQLYLLKRTIVV